MTLASQNEQSCVSEFIGRLIRSGLHLGLDLLYGIFYDLFQLDVDVVDYVCYWRSSLSSTR